MSGLAAFRLGSRDLGRPVQTGPGRGARLGEWLGQSKLPGPGRGRLVRPSADWPTDHVARNKSKEHFLEDGFRGSSVI